MMVSLPVRNGSLLLKAFGFGVDTDMEELKLLVTKTRSGDLDAYGAIVRRFQDMAYGFAYAVVGDFHLAENVAQEAFIDAYRKLPSLVDPAAFPGWFRRIVLTHCDRITRRQQVRTTALDAAAVTPATDLGPAEATEKREMQETVLAAIRALPEHQRMTTTLFYINGYSQKDIAEFLEVPVTTVKKRLHDARGRLKERMIDMVEETLHDNAPDEQFSKKVIDELLGRPRPLEIEGHPVREVWNLIRAALPDYEIIAGQEIVDKSASFNPWRLQFAYQPEPERVLRTETHDTTFQAIAGRTAPVRLAAAGRIFQHGQDASDIRHQLSVLCMAPGDAFEAIKATHRDVVGAVFSSVELRWDREATFHWFDPCRVAEIKLQGQWRFLGGCGVMTAKMLSDAGYDPGDVSGFMFGILLEDFAMLKYGIDDIRKLWQPPYVPT